MMLWVKNNTLSLKFNYIKSK